jgi:CRP-like cAMP-binding protein
MNALEARSPEEPRAPGVRLLDAEPDLGVLMTETELADARIRAVLPIVDLEPGDWRVSVLSQSPGVRGDVHGFLAVSGAVTLEVELVNRTSTRLVVPGDLVLLDGLDSETIPAVWRWAALTNVRLAVFDERLILFGHRWPSLLTAILKRGAAESRHAQLQHVVSQVPRVEDRLVLLFWTLADRIGTTRSDAVWVPLTLTQETIGRMIGARRPTVSLALRSVAQRGVITREADGWLLDRGSLARMGGQDPSLGQSVSGY